MYSFDTYHFVFIGAFWKIKYKLIGTVDYPELVDKLYVSLCQSAAVLSSKQQI